MEHDFHAIPEAHERRSLGSVLARIYRDIGLAAVANALDLPTVEFDSELAASIERGGLYLLLPPATAGVAEQAA